MEILALLIHFLRSLKAVYLKMKTVLTLNPLTTFGTVLALHPSGPHMLNFKV